MASLKLTRLTLKELSDHGVIITHDSRVPAWTWGCWCCHGPVLGCRTSLILDEIWRLKELWLEHSSHTWSRLSREVLAIKACNAWSSLEFMADQTWKFRYRGDLSWHYMSQHGRSQAQGPVVNLVVLNTPSMDVGDLLPTSVATCKHFWSSDWHWLAWYWYIHICIYA